MVNENEFMKYWKRVLKQNNGIWETCEDCGKCEYKNKPNLCTKNECNIFDATKKEFLTEGEVF